jgi:hypothetical protein
VSAIASGCKSRPGSHQGARVAAREQTVRILHVAGRSPAEQLGHLHEVIGSGLVPGRVRGDGVRRNAKMLGEALNCVRGRRSDVVRHEAQSGQRAELDRPRPGGCSVLGGTERTPRRLGVRVKNRMSSSRSSSGNPRRRSSSASEKTRVATPPPSAEGRSAPSHSRPASVSPARNVGFCAMTVATPTWLPPQAARKRPSSEPLRMSF